MSPNKSQGGRRDRNHRSLESFKYSEEQFKSCEMLSRKEFSKLCLSTFTPTTLVDIWVVKSLQHSVHCPLSGSQDDNPHLGHLDPLAVGVADGVEGLGVAVVAERFLGERGRGKYVQEA